MTKSSLVGHIYQPSTWMLKLHLFLLTKGRNCASDAGDWFLHEIGVIPHSGGKGDTCELRLKAQVWAYEVLCNRCGIRWLQGSDGTELCTFLLPAPGGITLYHCFWLFERLCSGSGCTVLKAENFWFQLCCTVPFTNVHLNHTKDCCIDLGYEAASSTNLGLFDKLKALSKKSAMPEFHSTGLKLAWKNPYAFLVPLPFIPWAPLICSFD